MARNSFTFITVLLCVVLDSSRVLLGSPPDTRDTLTTAVPLTTTKTLESTKPKVIIIPAYRAPIYHPNYNEFPRYPLVYYRPNYPLRSHYPSIYPPIGIRPLPYIKPILINRTQDRIILQRIDSNALPKLTNVNPWMKIQPYFKPSSNNAAGKKTILQLGGLKALPRPLISTSPLQNGNIITAFIMKNKQKMNYKILAPWSGTIDQQVSSTRPSIPVLENVLEENKRLHQTIKLDVNNHGDKIPLGGEPVSNSFSHYKQLQINETTQRPIEMNQFDSTTAPQNETDDSRQLDFGSGEEDNNEVDDTRGKFSTIATTDKSFLTDPEELIKRLRSNHAFAKNIKLYDFFKKQSTAFPKFVNINGKNCSVVVKKNLGEIHVTVNCDEKNFDNKTKRTATTYKSNVTFYTDELPDATTEPVKQLSTKI